MIKLGPHSLIETGDTIAWCDLNPTSSKLCYDFAPAQYIPEGTLVVGRLDENFIGSNCQLGQGDPTELGKQFAALFGSVIQIYSRVDVWEGPNEVNPGSPEEMNWYAKFLAEFARRIHEMGKSAAIGSFATGTPELSMWQYYRTALEACRDYNAYHARHCYGPLDDWHSFRYERDQTLFNQMGFSPKVLITECGEDAPNPPWRVKYDNNIERYYQEWIKPFILRVNKSVYVRGAHLFTVGTGFAPIWKPFDVCGTGLIQIMQQDLKEIQMPDPTPAKVIAEMRANPVNALWCTLHPGPDQVATSHRQITYTVDVYEIKATQSGVWYKVTPQGDIWMRGCDLLSQP